jgi:monolysocardiolipin acyltransferase
LPVVLKKTLKLFPDVLSDVKVYNKEVLIRAIDERPEGTPLITVANHFSCLDDPAIWGILRLDQLCNKNVMRWGLAAHNICFRELSHALIFLYGKGIPVVRGDGVFQEAMDLCLDKLKRGAWVHVFPEGRVNMTQEWLRLKWGVGRLVNESPTLPIVVPLWHIGLDEMLPNEPPYVPRPGKKILLNIGQPIDLSGTMDHVRESKYDEVAARKFITDKIQDELFVSLRKTLKFSQFQKFQFHRTYAGRLKNCTKADVVCHRI